MKSFLLCERFSPQTGLFSESWSALEREAYDSLSLSTTSDAICHKNKTQAIQYWCYTDVTKFESQSCHIILFLDFYHSAYNRHGERWFLRMGTHMIFIICWEKNVFPNISLMFFFFIFCLWDESAKYYCMLGVQYGCGRHRGRTTAFLAILVLVYFHTHPQHPWEHLSSGQL